MKLRFTLNNASYILVDNSPETWVMMDFESLQPIFVADRPTFHNDFLWGKLWERSKRRLYFSKYQADNKAELPGSRDFLSKFVHRCWVFDLHTVNGRGKLSQSVQEFSPNLKNWRNPIGLTVDFHSLKFSHDELIATLLVNWTAEYRLYK